MIPYSGHDLESYLTALRHQLWGSQVEAAIAAAILGLDIQIWIPGGIIHQGRDPMYCLRLKRQHFTLHKLHQKSQAKHACAEPTRAGMRPPTWTWENEENMENDDNVPEWALQGVPVQQGSLNTMRHEAELPLPPTRLTGLAQGPMEPIPMNVYVVLDMRRIPRNDIESLVLRVPRDMRVRTLRQTTANAINVPCESVGIYHNDDNDVPVADWQTIVEDTYCGASGQIPNDHVHVIVNDVTSMYVHVPITRTRGFVKTCWQGCWVACHTS